MKPAIAVLVTIILPLEVLRAADSDPERVFDVTETRFGAVADKQKDNTKAELEK